MTGMMRRSVVGRPAVLPDAGPQVRIITDSESRRRLSARLPIYEPSVRVQTNDFVEFLRNRRSNC